MVEMAIYEADSTLSTLRAIINQQKMALTNQAVESIMGHTMPTVLFESAG